MAGSFNKVLLMGNLTRDPEVRHLPSNMAVASFGVAVNRRFKTQEGEAREEVTFVDCEGFGRTAEFISKYFQKGSPIFIEGRLRLDEWNDKATGAKRTKLKVVVEGVEFAGSKSDNPGGGGAQRAATASRGAPAESGSNYQPMGEDDIPF